MASHPFRVAIERGDIDQALATLRPDVVLNSPVAFKPYTGDVARTLLRIVERTFEDFRYESELTDGDLTALIFRARVGDREVQGLDLLRDAPDGSGVAELTVMVRPLSAAVALAQTVGPQLEAAA
jgi:hypothetical protein